MDTHTASPNQTHELVSGRMFGFIVVRDIHDFKLLSFIVNFVPKFFRSTHIDVTKFKHKTLYFQFAFN